MRRWRCICVRKYGEPECAEPCHDFYSCRYWNGWKQVPFLTRLRWRVEYVWRVHVERRQDW